MTDMEDNNVGEVDNRRQLEESSMIKSYMLAGNAKLTLVSKKTGTRFTYKVRLAPNDEGKPDHKVPWFVSVLNGQDNENSFAFLGVIWKRYVDDSKANHFYEYKHGVKSGFGPTAPSAKAFAWFFSNLLDLGTIQDSLEVWHEGTCGKCGRSLTVPESIERGIGPECASKGLV